ncbi:MAG: hypothetical protein Q9163_003020 [Psora crenata]
MVNNNSDGAVIQRGTCEKAKGYPDISTRTFLRHLSHATLEVEAIPPIYVLADFDPDGIAILSTYKHGSHNLAHENANLNVPSISWLGIRSADIHHHIKCSTNTDHRGLVKLSGRDRKKGMRMLLNNAALAENGREMEWRREVQVMLFLNVKAEMEILAERHEGVIGWVEAELVERPREASSYGARMMSSITQSATSEESNSPKGWDNHLSSYRAQHTVCEDDDILQDI